LAGVSFRDGYLFLKGIATGPFRPDEGSAMAIEAVDFRLDRAKASVTCRKVLDDQANQRQHAIGGNPSEDRVAASFKGTGSPVFGGAVHVRASDGF
jgi:hypothetical protein